MKIRPQQSYADLYYHQQHYFEYSVFQLRNIRQENMNNLASSRMNLRWGKSVPKIRAAKTTRFCFLQPVLIVVYGCLPLLLGQFRKYKYDFDSYQPASKRTKVPCSCMQHSEPTRKGRPLSCLYSKQHVSSYIVSSYMVHTQCRELIYGHYLQMVAKFSFADLLPAAPTVQ